MGGRGPGGDQQDGGGGPKEATSRVGEGAQLSDQQCGGRGPGGDQLLGGRDRGSEVVTSRVGRRGPAGGALGKHSSLQSGGWGGGRMPCSCPAPHILSPQVDPDRPSALQPGGDAPGSPPDLLGGGGRHRPAPGLTRRLPRRSGVQGLLGDVEATPWALRAGTQRPGPGPGPGCAAPAGGPGRLLTSSGPRVPHRGEGLSSRRAVGAWCWVTRGPVPGLLSPDPPSQGRLPHPEARASRARTRR